MTERILVIDDDPIFQALAQENLARAGYDVVIAGDGVLALDMLTTEDFALSIVDLSMPRLDGFRLLALIRATPRLVHHPLLVATSRRDVKAIDEAFALGASAFHTKPMDWVTLPAQIRHTIRICSTIADLQRRLAVFTRPAQRRLTVVE